MRTDGEARVPDSGGGTREQVANELRTLVARGARQYWVFTGSFPQVYNHRNQHREAFRDVDFGDSLEVEYLPLALHVLPGLENQKLVTDGLVDWATRQWPPPATTG